MKGKIHNLITRQLGELTETGFWWCPECRAERHPNAVTFTENCFYCGSQVESKLENNEQETEKRELLAGLIEAVYEKYIICFNTAYEMGEVEEDAKASAEAHCEQIKLIEKSLSMKWPDIVQYLEVGE